MQQVHSQDGTAIAYDRKGSGPPLILVGGAFSYRLFPGFVTLANLLASRFTVINYDRRGRGGSGDSPRYAVEREVEDLAALIAALGGSAHVWGMSSGAVLALRAAAGSLPITRLALYEPPFLVDKADALPPADFGARLDELIATGKRGATVKYFMTKGMGVPGFIVTMMRFMPMWKDLKATSHTTAYDFAVMGDTLSGDPAPLRQFAAVAVPTLVMYGGKTEPLFHRAAQALAGVLPNARLQVLEGQGHNVSFEKLAPVLADFFGAEASRPQAAAREPAGQPVTLAAGGS
jgi:pimeloyl-ACP methyl ester carboxylesterase